MEEVKLCECGCGLTAPLAGCTNNKKGIIKGEPLRFIHGHHRRKHEHEMYKVNPTTGCWIWQLGTNRNKYGLISNQIAHRMIYEKYKGVIPDGLILDHLCRVTLCVNPDHLEPVTEAINTQRGLPAKLNQDKVKSMRNRFTTWADIGIFAEEYEVAWNTVYDALVGNSWKNVKGAIQMERSWRRMSSDQCRIKGRS